MASDRIRHSDRVLDAVRSGSAAAISPVAASWCRSALRHGLDPAAQRQRDRIGSAELAGLYQVNDELLAAATPVLDSLFGSVGRTGACVILSDAEGTILQSRSSAGECDVFEAVGLAAGFSWSEAHEGTNGIGTCLAEQRAVSILRGEHFASRNIDVSCMDAPIFDPDGRLAAALDVSSARPEHGGEAMAGLIAALVRDAASAIERDYFCRRFADARIMLAGDCGKGGPALLAVDRDDLVIGATRAARRLLRLGDAARLDPRPFADVMGQGHAAGFEDGERAVLRQALARAGGNVSAAARLLGIARATMYRRMERAGLVAGGMN